MTFCSSVRFHCQWKWSSTFGISSAFTQPWRRIANALYSKKKKREIIRTSSHLRLHSVMSVAVLWRECLLPLKKPSANSCFLRGKYSCQFDPRECLKLALSCSWLRAWQSHEDSLSWPVGDWHPRSRNGFNHPSSKGFKLYEVHECQPAT